MIVGNDISAFQGDPDYNTLKNNSNFIILKATEGTGFRDPKLTRNQIEARRVDLPLGYYHFARPDLGNLPEVEAAYFLSQIGEIHNGEVLCLDYEPNWNGDAVRWCRAFLDYVYLKTRCKPLIYLNKSQVAGFDWSPVSNAGYGLWLACYDNNLITGAWDFAAMQQWTSSQLVPGINSKTDGDYFFGTVDQFKTYGYKKPVVPSPSVSPSPSASQSPSPSPSPTAPPVPPVDPVDPDIVKYLKLTAVINAKWTWLGKTGWKTRLAQLKSVLNNIA